MLLVWLQQKRVLATDTLLGILAHAALSFGMVALSLLQARVDLQAYLFGDILTVTVQELWWIYIGGAMILTLLLRHWDALVLMTVHEDLARAEGGRGFRSQLMLMFLMTLVVAISIRMVGILLITSMLIIPAATARQLARSPESMAAIAALLGACAVLGGMAMSLAFDTPTGPTIVTVATALFVLLLPFARIASRR